MIGRKGGKKERVLKRKGTGRGKGNAEERKDMAMKRKERNGCGRGKEGNRDIISLFGSLDRRYFQEAKEKAPDYMTVQRSLAIHLSLYCRNCDAVILKERSRIILSHLGEIYTTN